MMQRLENDRWGFESNCFVCEDRNPAGLRIPFFHDTDSGEIRADFTLADRFSGAPTYVHGGVVLAILDEAMAWATIAAGGTFAVTKETTTRFRAPVRVGEPHRVRAQLVDDGNELVCEASVHHGADLCATARATFVALGPAQAVDAVGAEITDVDARFVRPPREEQP